jgi:transposase-like protein
LVSRAKAGGLQLTGEGGVLQQLTKRLLESALDGEITDRLGYDKHDPAGRGTGNSRNGSRSKTVLTDIGPVRVNVPRDRDASFDPKIVAKRQKRLTGVDEMVISLAAKGRTTGEISAPGRGVWRGGLRGRLSPPSLTRCSKAWSNGRTGPSTRLYPVIFVDAIHVKFRDGQVANRLVYVALAVTCEGHCDILGLWAGDGGEGAKYWLHVLTELKNRGIVDVLMVFCGGLTGLPDAITTVWPATITQTCIVHLLRNSFRYAGRQHWQQIAKALNPVYTAATEAAARERFAEFVEAWGARYPAVVGQRLAGVRALPRVRPGDSTRHLLHQRDRVSERPDPPGREGPWSLPQRPSRTQMRLHGCHEPRPATAANAGPCAGNPPSTPSTAAWPPDASSSPSQELHRSFDRFTVLTSWAGRSGVVVAVVPVGLDLHWLAERWRVDHQAAADVEADVVDLGVGVAVEDEVAREQWLAPGHAWSGVELGVSGAGQGDSGRAVGGGGESGAVEAAVLESVDWRRGLILRVLYSSARSHAVAPCDGLCRC